MDIQPPHVDMGSIVDLVSMVRLDAGITSLGHLVAL